MTQSSPKNRIIFIDLMRAFAVLQMVQGHTTDVLLSNDYRNVEYIGYSVWLFMRGMTAPIFLFSAGTVFTYLFRLVHKPFNENSRVSKGLKRAVFLVFIGYMLRFPTPTLVDFSSVAEAQWITFFSVDVLHLIGVSLFMVITLIWISEKTKLGDSIIFTIATLIFFLTSLYTEQVEWGNFLPAPLASYLYQGTGSLFPLFPWSGYVLAGAVLGSYLAKKPGIFRSAKFSTWLLVAGIGIMLFAQLVEYIEFYWLGEMRTWNTSPYLVFFRLGFVLVLNSIVSFISLKVESIPKLLVLLGRNTLLIYVFHLVILYGSAWNAGISLWFGKQLGVGTTISAALTMIILMCATVIIINKLKIKNKQLVTS
ncbi:MAG: DUF1624 domain-containing protein [Ignavibacteria bacterium]|nr:DUF1624 domain-containing protein [Ignavibacteria bacterium]